MGGADSRGDRRDHTRRLRERVVRSRLGASHEQALGAVDGRLVPLRTGAPTSRPPCGRCAAHSSFWKRSAAAHPADRSSIAIPRHASGSPSACAMRESARCSGVAVEPAFVPATLQRLGFVVATAPDDGGGRAVGRDGAAAPRRRAPGNRPHRGDRPSPRVRTAAVDLPRHGPPAGSARRRTVPATTAAASPDRRRLLGGNHLRFCRGSRCPSVRRPPRRTGPHRESAVREVRGAAALAGGPRPCSTR